jgi:hypothetical protein
MEAPTLDALERFRARTKPDGASLSLDLASW